MDASQRLLRRYRIGLHSLVIPEEGGRVEFSVSLELRSDPTTGCNIGSDLPVVGACGSNLPQTKPGDDVEQRAVETARRLLILAAKRAILFDDGASRDPGWNILLDLLVQHSVGRPVSVSSACIASLAPPTTALRHINALIRSGKLERVPDPRDQRRTHLRLSPTTRIALVNLLLAGALAGH